MPLDRHFLSYQLTLLHPRSPSRPLFKDTLQLIPLEPHGMKDQSHWPLKVTINRPGRGVSGAIKRPRSFKWSRIRTKICRRRHLHHGSRTHKLKDLRLDQVRHSYHERFPRCSDFDSRRRNDSRKMFDSKVPIAYWAYEWISEPNSRSLQ